MADIVVAHGAWAAGWAWRKMRPLLGAAGHRLFTPTYTGLGERSHLAHRGIDLETHVADLLGVLAFEDLRDVVLLAHSYGGMVGTSVADRARDRIAHLIYLDAFVPQDGQSLLDLEPVATRDAMRQRAAESDGWRVPPLPLPPDTPEQEAAWIIERRVPHPLRCFEQKFTLRGGPLTLPRAYVYCTRCPPHDPFRRFADHARLQGWACERIESSHSPQITAPQTLADMLERLIREG